MDVQFLDPEQVVFCVDTFTQPTGFLHFFCKRVDQFGKINKKNPFDPFLCKRSVEINRKMKDIRPRLAYFEICNVDLAFIY